MDSKNDIETKNEVDMVEEVHAFRPEESDTPPEKKALEKKLLWKVDILIVGLTSLIFLVNQWVSRTSRAFTAELTYAGPWQNGKRAGDGNPARHQHVQRSILQRNFSVLCVLLTSCEHYHELTTARCWLCNMHHTSEPDHSLLQGSSPAWRHRDSLCDTVLLQRMQPLS